MDTIARKEITPETVYEDVLYQGRRGTLKLTDEKLSHHTLLKVAMLPWKKVVRRQVATAGGKHKTKLVLESGNEAIFEVNDPVTLSVLRDDLAERLLNYRKYILPTQEKAINKTAAPMARRESTPYRYVSASARDVTNIRALPPKVTSERRMSTPYRFVSQSSLRNLQQENGNGTKQPRPQQNRRASAPVIQHQRWIDDEDDIRVSEQAPPKKNGNNNKRNSFRNSVKSNNNFSIEDPKPRPRRNRRASVA